MPTDESRPSEEMAGAKVQCAAEMVVSIVLDAGWGKNLGDAH